MSQTLRLHLPAVDARALDDALQVARAGLERLYVSGRLRGLIESTEGRTVLQAFEGGVASAFDQSIQALSAGADSVRLQIDVPRSHASVVAALARKLIEMLADAEVMGSVGSEPLNEAQRSLCDGLISYADGVIAAARGV